MILDYSEDANTSILWSKIRLDMFLRRKDVLFHKIKRAQHQPSFEQERASKLRTKGKPVLQATV